MKTIKLFLLILFLGICTTFFLENPPREESKNLFTSGLYSDYLKAWGRPDTLKTREYHEAFVQSLRQEGSDQQVKTLFLAKDLNPSWKSYLESSVEIPKGNLLNFHRQLKKDSRFNSIRHKSDFEDQMLLANLPSWVADYQGTALIRMGQPALLGNWFSPTVVAPEFIRFAKNQPRHLYINLMKRSGTEGTLSSAIEALEADIPSLIVVTLDKNSSFYDQENPSLQSKESFKNAFLMHLQGTDYYWSSKMDPIPLEQFLNDVDQRYFAHQNELSQQERGDFIELFYLALLDWAQAKYLPQSMNITCRQGIDRGPSLMTLWLLKNGAITREEAVVQLFVPPLLFHNRPPHAERLLRFESAANRL